MFWPCWDVVHVLLILLTGSEVNVSLYIYVPISNNGLPVGTMHECTCVGASETSKGAGTTTIID